MKLQDQCCTRFQAEQLTRLGINIPGQFAITPIGNVMTKVEAVAKKLSWIAVYSSAELGVILPDDTRSYQLEHSWQIYYPGENAMDLFLSEDCDTEAQIRAAHLIWLLETNAITADEVNKRLEA